MLNIVIATTNQGKLKEFQALLQHHSTNFKSLNEFSKIEDVEETGKTFYENAELKAIYYALKTRHWTLADDSGLEVEALGNAPGVYSARYAGENANNEQRIEKLLKELEKTNNPQRNARFVCEMVIADEQGNVKFSAQGVCKGSIAFAPIGKNGFGYDPIFVPQGFTETFGELSDEVKQQISHRALATQKIIEYLRQNPVS